MKHGIVVMTPAQASSRLRYRQQELLLRPVEGRANLSLVVTAQHRPVTGVKVEARDVAEAGMHLRMCSAAFMRRACCLTALNPHMQTYSSIEAYGSGVGPARTCARRSAATERCMRCCTMRCCICPGPLQASPEPCLGSGQRVPASGARWRLSGARAAPSAPPPRPRRTHPGPTPD